MTKAATLAALVVCALFADSAEAAERASPLPPGPGRDEVELYCSYCHSLKIVTQQGLSRKDWDELLVWMVDEQGMAEIEAEDRKLVLDYLAAKISVERIREMRRQR